MASNSHQDDGEVAANESHAAAIERVPASSDPSADIPVPPPEIAGSTMPPPGASTEAAATESRAIEARGPNDGASVDVKPVEHRKAGVDDEPTPDAHTSTQSNDTLQPQPSISRLPEPESHSAPATTPFSVATNPSPMSSGPSQSTSATTSTRSRGRGPGRPRGTRAGGSTSTRGTRTSTANSSHNKRKRPRSDSHGSASSLTDSSIEISTPLATTTKSGRNITKPTAYVPPAAASPTTTANGSASKYHNGTAGPGGEVKKKRAYRRNPESAVCKVCLRGVSPASNMIVFCDGCNSPYHRYCHHPMIDQSVVDEVDKEWYCVHCRPGTAAATAAQGSSGGTVDGQGEGDVEGYGSLEGVGVEQRRQYFDSLSKPTLVALLVKATTLKADLPIYSPLYQKQGLTGQANGHGSSKLAEYDRVPDEHPPNYPHPGHGLMKTLPPEKQDLKHLVDEEDKYGVFSHIYQADPVAANAGLNSKETKS